MQAEFFLTVFIQTRRVGISSPNIAELDLAINSRVITLDPDSTEVQKRNQVIKQNVDGMVLAQIQFSQLAGYRIETLSISFSLTLLRWIREAEPVLA